MDGDLEPAEPLVRAFLLKHGDQVEAMRLLARIGIAREVFDDAELLLAAVLALAPEYRAARREYARGAHRPSQVSRGAPAELDRLLREEPDNRLYYKTLYATTSVGLGEHERAVAFYRDLLTRDPRGCRCASVDCACAEDPRAARGGDRVLPQRGRLPAGLRRCLLEPREPQDLPLHRTRSSLQLRAAEAADRLRDSSTASISASRSARRWRIGANYPESFR